MTTIINGDEPQGRTAERTTVVSGGDSSGWAVAVIILLAVIVGGVYLWVHYRRAPQSGTNVNITLPSTGSSNTTQSY